MNAGGVDGTGCPMPQVCRPNDGTTCDLDAAGCPTNPPVETCTATQMPCDFGLDPKVCLHREILATIGPYYLLVPDKSLTIPSLEILALLVNNSCLLNDFLLYLEGGFGILTLVKIVIRL